MDNVYFDIESGKTVTIDQLKTENNGTLEMIRPKINPDFFKGFRRLMGYDENGQPIWHINK